MNILFKIPVYYRFLGFITLSLAIVVAVLSNFSVIMLAPIFRTLLGGQSSGLVWDDLIIGVIDGKSAQDKLLILAVIFLGVSFAKFLVQILYSFLTAKFIYGMRSYFEINMFNRYSNEEFTRLSSLEQGFIFSNILDRPGLATDFLNSAIQFARSVFLVVMSYIFLYLTDPYIGLIVGLAIILIYFFAIIIRGWFKNLGVNIVKRTQQLSSLCVQSFNIIKEAKVLGFLAPMQSEFSAKSNLRSRAYIANYFFQLLPTNSFELVFSLGGVLFIMVYVYLGGDIVELIPKLLVVAGLTYGIFSQLFNSVEKLLNAMAFSHAFAASISETSHSDYNVSNIPRNNFHSCNLTEGLSCEGLSFRYPDGSLAFDALSFATKSQGLVVIKGESGSGKSTFVNILLGLLPGYNGSIKVNGVEISSLPFESVTQYFSYSSQNNSLLSKTIEQNIAVYQDEISLENLNKAIENSAIRDFVESQPQGLNSLIADGSSLSGGQLQRISLARSFYFDQRPILVLDEPTSALDVKNEKQILSNLIVLARKKLIVVVSHSANFQRAADQVIEFK